MAYFHLKTKKFLGWTNDSYGHTARCPLCGEHLTTKMSIIDIFTKEVSMKDCFEDELKCRNCAWESGELGDGVYYIEDELLDFKIAWNIRRLGGKFIGVQRGGAQELYLYNAKNESTLSIKIGWYMFYDIARKLRRNR